MLNAVCDLIEFQKDVKSIRLRPVGEYMCIRY